MIPSLSIIALIAVFSKLSVAFNPATDRAKCQNGGFCLTSFRWCDTDERWSSDCSFPSKVYPLSTNRPGDLVTVAISYFDDYTVSWQGADPQYPVLLEWFPGAVAGFSSSLQSRGIESLWARSSELTGPGSLFLEDLIREPLNLSETQNRFLFTQQPGVLRISQPNRPAPAGFVANTGNDGLAWVDESQRFLILQDGYIETAVILANNATNRRWRLGVGIGVGLGVPLLLVLTFWLARSLGIKKGILQQQNRDFAKRETQSSTQST